MTLREATGDRAGTGRVEFDRLQLAPLCALAAHLPLPERLRTDLARLRAARDADARPLALEGPADALRSYAAAAEFGELGIIAQDAFPGASGLTGRFDATQEGGELRISSANATLDLPRVLPVRSRSTPWRVS